MANKLLSTVLAALIALNGSIPAAAHVADNLPDIGTTAGNTLTIGQELTMGDYYLRTLRGGAPIIYDPLLNSYINQLGQRLSAHADGVKTPFHFHLIRNDEINAFAFFGGNVVLHSGLFRQSDNESQLASVVAHEIAHVTQRHLARAMEAQRRNAPIIWASALGSIFVAMANPEAGMAALTTTLAGAQQGAISFTQSNEQEADRIGMAILTRAGFSPQAMPDFLTKLSDTYRYTSKPPEILLTHPLPDSRLADTRNRANQLTARKDNSSLDYYLAKVRVLNMYSRGVNPQYKQQFYAELARGNDREKIALQYGQAIDAYNAKDADTARQILQPLLTSQPNNLWFIDLMTDIDLSQSRYQPAINRLEAALKKQPSNPVLQINLANAYIESKQPDKATSLLNRYTFANPDDVNGWDLLSKAAAAQGSRDQELAARAEIFALMGNIEQATSMLTGASRGVSPGSLQQARYDARIEQLRQLQQRFNQFARM